MKPHGYTLLCSKHYWEEKENNKPKQEIGLTVIDKTHYAGTEMSENHYKHLNTRVSTPDGETLSGEKGLEYMKSQGDTYVPRLKEYYK